MARVKQTIREKPAETKGKKEETQAKPKKASAADVPAKPKAAKTSKGAKTPKPAEKPKRAKAAKPASSGIAAKRRWHPGTVARREIRRLRKTVHTDLHLQRGPFRTMVAIALRDNPSPVARDAIREMQSIVESEALTILEVAQMLVKLRNQTTCTEADIDNAIALLSKADSFSGNH